MRLLTRKQAIIEGYIIDDCAAGGPIGYKGPRFLNTESMVHVLSEREEKLVAALGEADAYLREIRAENLDGSEPALGELLETNTALFINIEGEV